MNELEDNTEVSDIRLVIVTGMSGAGRTEAMRVLEDIGYFCVDNLPPRFIFNLIELLEVSNHRVRHIAAACDVRSQEFFPELLDVINKFKEKNVPSKVIFLEAEDEVLLKRFKRDRRKHPLSETGDILSGIRTERKMLRDIRELSDLVVDTSKMETSQLKERLKEYFLGPKKKRSLKITVLSFGFKYGIPLDTDLLFDVRFLPNPYYVDELKALTGKDEKVREFILSHPKAKEFLELLKKMLDFLIPNYEKEGKTHLMIALGCTGGKHRSVVFADEIKKYLAEKDFSVTVAYRDIGQEP